MTRNELEPIILERLSEFFKRPFKPEELDQSYDSLGADSMDMVILAHELESVVGKKINPELFMQHDSLSAAIDALFNNACCL